MVKPLIFIVFILGFRLAKSQQQPKQIIADSVQWIEVPTDIPSESGARISLFLKKIFFDQ
jgi:hypothetical protein